MNNGISYGKSFTTNIAHHNSPEKLVQGGYIPKNLSLEEMAEVCAVKGFIDRKFGTTQLKLLKSNSHLVAYFASTRDGTIYELNIPDFNQSVRQNGIDGSLEKCVRSYYPCNSISVFMMLKGIFSERARQELRAMGEKKESHAEMMALLEEGRAYNREQNEAGKLG